MSTTTSPSKRIRTDTQLHADAPEESIHFHRPWWFGRCNIAECNGFTAWVRKRDCDLPTVVVKTPPTHPKAVLLPVSIKGTEFESIIERASERNLDASCLASMRADMAEYQHRDATAQEITMANTIAQFTASATSVYEDTERAFAKKVAAMSPEMRKMAYTYGYIAQQIGDGIVLALVGCVTNNGGDTLKRLTKACARPTYPAQECERSTAAPSEDTKAIPECMREYVNSIEFIIGCGLSTMVCSLYVNAAHPMHICANKAMDVASSIDDITRMYLARHMGMDDKTRAFITAFNGLVQTGMRLPNFQINEIPTDLAQYVFIDAATAYNTKRNDVLTMITDLFDA